MARQPKSGTAQRHLLDFQASPKERQETDPNANRLDAERGLMGARRLVVDHQPVDASAQSGQQRQFDLPDLDPAAQGRFDDGQPPIPVSIQIDEKRS